jgi:hypothetical protein
MKGTKMTEYTFEIKGAVKVTLKGSDTEENYQKALDKAVREAAEKIDIDWVDGVDVEEFMDNE